MILLEEVWVDQWCDNCQEQHRGLGIRFRHPTQGVAFLMQDPNWTPIEAIAAFLEEICDEEIRMEKDL